MQYKKGDDKCELVNADTSLLMSLFNHCHDLIWQGGKKNPAEAFDEMSKLLFCKVRDERDCRNGQFYQFQLKANEAPDAVARRIRTLYSAATTKGPEIFQTEIDLDDEIISEAVLALQSVSLSRSDIDAKGRAFETFTGKIFRGELGQFFTPREIVKFMVRILEPTSEDTIIDPSCGSGGFLLHSLEYVRDGLYATLDEKEAHHAEVDFIRNHLYGIEINHQIARVAMMDMILHDDGHTNIEPGDGLDDFGKYNARRAIKEGKYTMVLQNPPFGFPVRRGSSKYVKQYELASGKNQISSQILFIERAFDLLKPGGKMGVVVPDSIATNSTTQYVRDYIMQRFMIVAVVSLPKETFMPTGTGVKTSILFLQKKTAAQALAKDSYPVFMAVAKHVGYDATGKPGKNDLFEIDLNGKVIKDRGILGEYQRFKNDPAHYKFPDVLQLTGVKDE